MKIEKAKEWTSQKGKQLKKFAAAGALASALLVSGSGCSDGSKIELNRDKESVSFSLRYWGPSQGLWGGPYDFNADISIEKSGDEFIVKIDEDGKSRDQEYRGKNIDSLLKGIEDEYVNRVPILRGPGNNQKREKVLNGIRGKIAFVLEQYKMMLKNPDSLIKQQKITYDPKD